jgi:hypothetical protein
VLRALFVRLWPVPVMVMYVHFRNGLSGGPQSEAYVDEFHFRITVKAC